MPAILYRQSRNMTRAYTLYAPRNPIVEHGEPTTFTPLLTICHPLESRFPRFLFHKATPQHSANLIYKGIAGLTQHVAPPLQLEPSTPEHTLQQILDDEMTSPLHETVVIAPLLSKILYRHLHTHCSINRPLWHTDSPARVVQALGTHQCISMRTLVPIPAPSPPV
jgi:hypothetical protein